MNWKFCIYTPTQRALDLCNGSMNKGDCWGDGWKGFHSDEAGEKS